MSTTDEPCRVCDGTGRRSSKPNVICNLCGLSCALGDPGDPIGGLYGLINAKVSGGSSSTAANGWGALDDGETYTFSLCEFCLDWLFGRFVKPVDVHEYMDETLVWRPAEERVATDEWREGKDRFRVEAERHARARVKCERPAKSPRTLLDEEGRIHCPACLAFGDRTCIGAARLPRTEMSQPSAERAYEVTDEKGDVA